MKKPRSLCKQKTLRRDRRPSRRRLKQSASDRRGRERRGWGRRQKGTTRRGVCISRSVRQTARHQWNAFIFITPDQNNRDVYFENLPSLVLPNSNAYLKIRMRRGCHGSGRVHLVGYKAPHFAAGSASGREGDTADKPNITRRKSPPARVV